MYTRTCSEKKGLASVTQEDILNQGKSFQILSVLPPITVVPFRIERKPVLPNLLSPNDIDETENVDPTDMKQTEAVKLVRAEKPITFDVISLTRATAGEENPNAVEFGEEAIIEEEGAEDDQGGEWEF